MTPSRFSQLQHRIGTLILLALILLGAWWAYHPGLTGGFQFDDFANLPILGATGPVGNWPTFWRYITSGAADPTGRPVALLSFLIDAHNWPADPRPFLRTSIILHLINGALLFALLRCLGRVLTARASAMRWRVELAALLGTAFWLLHPLMVSTTLYIVQREAMLAATFVLIGLLLWLHGRTRMLAGHPLSGFAWMALGLGGGTLLAVLSKANGILLPALALVIEYTILRHHCAVTPPVHDGVGAHSEVRQQWYRRSLLVLGWIPACIVAAYLLHRGYDGFVHGVPAIRTWTEGQRLLTQPRVLMNYWQLLWLPRPFTPGLFNDQIHASTLLLQPWTTLPCLLAVLGLIAGALVLRKRWPTLALAILFYFVGQSLESSTIALELFYEHRNYLPAMLMFWPLTLWLCGVHQSTRVSASTPHPGRWTTIGKGMVAIALLAGLGVMTHARASVWGNTREQAALWAKLNPTSPRAQANAAMSALHAGRPRRAAAHLRDLLEHQPDQVQLALNLLAAECATGRVTPSTLQAAKTSLATTRNPGALLAHWFERAINQTAHPSCPQLTLHTIEQLLAAAHDNPHLMDSPGRRQDLLYLQGLIALKRNQPDQALASFKHSLNQNVRPSAAFQQVAQLGSHGYPRRGLSLLHDYETVARQHTVTPAFGMPRVHAWVLQQQHYWQRGLKQLRDTLQQDITMRGEPKRDR